MSREFVSSTHFVLTLHSCSVEKRMNKKMERKCGYIYIKYLRHNVAFELYDPSVINLS